MTSNGSLFAHLSMILRYRAFRVLLSWFLKQEVLSDPSHVGFSSFFLFSYARFSPTDIRKVMARSRASSSLTSSAELSASGCLRRVDRLVLAYKFKSATLRSTTSSSGRVSFRAGNDNTQRSKFYNHGEGLHQGLLTEKS